MSHTTLLDEQMHEDKKLPKISLSGHDDLLSVDHRRCSSIEEVLEENHQSMEIRRVSFGILVNLSQLMQFYIIF